MKRALLVGLAFLLVTLPATWLWLEWGQQAYGSVFGPTARTLYDLLGLDGIPVKRERLRYINLVPFVGLMLVTPGLPLRRRLGGLAVGLLLLFASHLLLNALGSSIPGGTRLPTTAAIVSDALPFVLWVAIAREPLKRFVRRDKSELTPDSST